MVKTEYGWSSKAECTYGKGALRTRVHLALGLGSLHFEHFLLCPKVGGPSSILFLSTFTLLNRPLSYYDFQDCPLSVQNYFRHNFMAYFTLLLIIIFSSEVTIVNFSASFPSSFELFNFSQNFPTSEETFQLCSVLSNFARIFST